MIKMFSILCLSFVIVLPAYAHPTEAENKANLEERLNEGPQPCGVIPDYHKMSYPAVIDECNVIDYVATLPKLTPLLASDQELRHTAPSGGHGAPVGASMHAGDPWGEYGILTAFGGVTAADPIDSVFLLRLIIVRNALGTGINETNIHWAHHMNYGPHDTILLTE